MWAIDVICAVFTLIFYLVQFFLATWILKCIERKMVPSKLKKNLVVFYRRGSIILSIVDFLMATVRIVTLFGGTKWLTDNFDFQNTIFGKIIHFPYANNFALQIAQHTYHCLYIYSRTRVGLLVIEKGKKDFRFSIAIFVAIPVVFGVLVFIPPHFFDNFDAFYLQKESTFLTVSASVIGIAILVFMVGSFWQLYKLLKHQKNKTHGEKNLTACLVGAIVLMMGKLVDLATTVSLRVCVHFEWNTIAEISSALVPVSRSLLSLSVFLDTLILSVKGRELIFLIFLCKKTNKVRNITILPPKGSSTARVSQLNVSTLGAVVS